LKLLNDARERGLAAVGKLLPLSADFSDRSFAERVGAERVGAERGMAGFGGAKLAYPVLARYGDGDELAPA